MTEAKNLTRRQRALIEDLFTAELDEQEVLDKHHVSSALYNRWLADEHFVLCLERRMAQAYRSGRLILARYATVAAGKLVHLTDCEKEEVARKACLDIITLDNPAAGSRIAAEHDDTSETELPPETARRILAALAAPPDDTEITSP